ncbi:unnamed protein product, partial [Amoebophrya sp. A120]
LISLSSFALLVETLAAYHSQLGSQHPTLVVQASALTTESGFYYSFYEEFIRAESWADAWRQLLFDERSEYPNNINALSRFNIYAEVSCGVLFRAVHDCHELWVAFMALEDEQSTSTTTSSTRRWSVEEVTLYSWHFYQLVLFLINALGQGALVAMAFEFVPRVKIMVTRGEEQEETSDDGEVVFTSAQQEEQGGVQLQDTSSVDARNRRAGSGFSLQGGDDCDMEDQQVVVDRRPGMTSHKKVDEQQDPLDKEGATEKGTGNLSRHSNNFSPRRSCRTPAAGVVQVFVLQQACISSLC